MHTSCAVSAAAVIRLQPCAPHALWGPASSWKVAVGQATVLQRLEEEGASSPGGGRTGRAKRGEW
jgi:hypothetical protein